MNDEEIKVEAGKIYKAAYIGKQNVDESELKKINKYTIAPLTAEEVFTFKTLIGDNEADDRNYQPFTAKALKDLAELYKGKTVIKNHRSLAENQIARVYDTEIIVDSSRKNKIGEEHTELIGKCYMVRTESNKELIKEIEAGIKKEVSSGFSVDKAICSICGKDNVIEYCRHWPGETYSKEGKDDTCLFWLDGAKEAYELSLVAIPAQPRAGTVKAFGEKAFFKYDLPLEDKKETETKETTKEAEIDSTELELNELWAFIEAEKE